MSAQRLSARSIRRIERSTGLSIRRAWSWGGYRMEFVTADHRHGAWHRRTGEWCWIQSPMHYTSCDEMFPKGES